jgi:hypothetical protein
MVAVVCFLPGWAKNLSAPPCMYTLYTVDAYYTCSILQECILGIKQDMPVHLFVSPAYFIAAVFFLGGGGGNVT